MLNLFPLFCVGKGNPFGCGVLLLSMKACGRVALKYLLVLSNINMKRSRSRKVIVLLKRDSGGKPT